MDDYWSTIFFYEPDEPANMPTTETTTPTDIKIDTDMCPSDYEACIGFENTNVTDATQITELPSASPKSTGATKAKAASKPKSAPKPKKRSKSKGRSNGDKSSATIKKMRTQAKNGDIDAAIRLGWSVERITDLYNREKKSKGVDVKPGTPIDDAVINRRLYERRTYQAACQKKRQDKLRKAAWAGDSGAAKLLKMGKKRFQEILENLSLENLSLEEGGQGEVDIEDVRAAAMAADAARERTPAEPRNFEQEEFLDQHKDWLAGLPLPVPEGSKSTGAIFGLANSYLASGFEITNPSGPATPASDPFYIPVAMSPPRYPFGQGFLPRLPAGPGNKENSMMHITAQKENQASQQVQKKLPGPAVLKDPGTAPERIKGEVEKKFTVGHKKLKKPMPTNFPVEEVVKMAQEDVKVQKPTQVAEEDVAVRPQTLIPVHATMVAPEATHTVNLMGNSQWHH